MLHVVLQIGLAFFRRVQKCILGGLSVTFLIKEEVFAVARTGLDLMKLHVVVIIIVTLLLVVLLVQFQRTNLCRQRFTLV